MFMGFDLFVAQMFEILFLSQNLFYYHFTQYMVSRTNK